jgi:type II secretory pathway component GspD/PulD (secretin)
VRDNPLIRFLYEPEANALIVVAPQSVQRQFEAIVKRLKQPAPK